MFTEFEVGVCVSDGLIAMNVITESSARAND